MLFPLVLFSLFITTSLTNSSATSEDLKTSPLMMKPGKRNNSEKNEPIDSQRQQDLRGNFSYSCLILRGNRMPHIEENNLLASEKNGNPRNPESNSGQVTMRPDKSLEAVRIEAFLERIKSCIDPETDALLVSGIEQGQLNPNPFFAGLDWRNKIKETNAFKAQPPEQQENHIKTILRCVQQAYCVAHDLPYRLDAEGRIERVSLKERIDALLKKEQEIAENISDESLGGDSYLVGGFLKFILPSAPSAQGLVAKFEEADSLQEKIKVLNEIKKIGFSIDSKLPILEKNLENKAKLVSFLERSIELGQQRSKLAEKIFNGKTVPRLRNWEFFAYSLHESISFKEQQQVALKRIEQLSPVAEIVKKLQEGTVPIGRAAINELVRGAPFDETVLGAEKLSMEKAQADLKKQIFQYLCHNITFKFNQTYYEVAALNKDKPEFLVDENGQEQINPLSTLQEKLRYMILFLELLSRSNNEIENNSEAVEVSDYDFLEKANNMIRYVNSSLTDGHSDPQLAEQSLILPGPSALERIKMTLDVTLSQQLTPGDMVPMIGRGYRGINMLASLRELERGVSNQNNPEAAYYHLRAARFLMESAYPYPKSTPDWYESTSSDNMQQIGRLFALAACCKEWEDNPSVLSAEQVQIVHEDNWKSQDYANLAISLTQGERSTLFNGRYYSQLRCHDDGMNRWPTLKHAIKSDAVALAYFINESNSFNFYRASLAERYARYCMDDILNVDETRTLDFDTFMNYRATSEAKERVDLYNRITHPETKEVCVW
ncbi:MAG: hypothetical protein K2W97_02020 [Chthoniobacterales bacterium]|nr:hypothetical protein [Chthoniobacterales bacterium]